METTDMAREVVDQARKEYAGSDEDEAAGYEPTLIRHIAAALEAVEAEVLVARDRAASLVRELAQARADLQDQTDENEKARIQIERAEASDEEQGDAEDTITVAKDTRRIVLEIQDEARRRAGSGCPPEIPATERFLAGLPAEPPPDEVEVTNPTIGGGPSTGRIKVGPAVSKFLRGKRAPYEKPTVVPWEVRFAEIVADRVKLRDRVDDLLAANSLEIQKRRHAEVRRDDWESAHQAQKERAEHAESELDKGAATAVDLFDHQYQILSRYRVALMACRDHSGPVDQIVREALEDEA